MTNECSVTQYKRNLVNAENALRIGELKVTVFPSSVFTIAWNNFDSAKDSYRILSGTATVSTGGGGYTVTAGSNGCVIAVSNKYDIVQLNGSGEQVCYEFDANQFEWCENVFFTVSRGKIKGDVKYLQNGSIRWSNKLDLSEAEGNIDLAKFSDFTVLSNSNNVSLVATGDFTAFGGDVKVSFLPSLIPMEYCQVVNDILSCKGPQWVGNIETDFRISAIYNRIRLDGGQATGQLEKWIEKMATVKTTGSTLRVYSTSSITLNSQTLVNANYLFHFNADTVTVTVGSDATVIGTYTKATGTWSWV